MPVTAWRYAGTGAEDTAVGQAPWGGAMSLITVEDGSEITCGLNTFWGPSYYAKGTNFGFTSSHVPTDATIDGIEVRWRRRSSSAAGDINDEHIRIVKSDGTIGTTDKADTVTAWPEALTKATYGGASDLWGETWTPADIHDSDFGAVLSASRSNGATTAYVDCVEIRVHYTEASAPTGTSAVTLPVVTMSASGAAATTGTSAITTPAPVLSATGEAEHYGTGAVTLPAPELASSGTVYTTGTAALTTPLTTVSASGALGHSATSAFTIPAPEMAATGQRTETGTSALTLPAPLLAATGTLGHTGTSAITLPIPVMVATNALPKIGTAAMTLPLCDLLAAATRSRAPLSVSTTTPDTIRDDIIGQIKGLTPSHARFKDPWREVETIEVNGRLRNFYVECMPGVRVDEGYWGDGVERVFELRVWTDYSGLHVDHDDSILTEDGAQLADLIRSRREPTVPGFLAVFYVGWQPADDSEDGHIWGYHEFEARYYGAY